MVTALVSLLTHRCVREDIAMTGEISLRGMVMPVGGIKEKVLAAHRAGLSRVLLPERNRKDLVDIPKEIQEQMEITFVSTIEEVINLSLKPSKVKPSSKKKTFTPHGLHHPHSLRG
jgi:ATP-dependent Lon protease